MLNFIKKIMAKKTKKSEKDNQLNSEHAIRQLMKRGKSYKQALEIVKHGK